VEYRPKPIPTAGAKLSPDIDELVELLAKNAHEIWAQRHLADGWKFGRRRDDVAKEHPCLVP
jgi:hypothetical protein